MTSLLSRHAFLPLIAAAMLGACAHDSSPAASAAAGAATPAQADGDADLVRAREAAAAFSGRLRQRLQSAMQSGGPVAAVEVCHTEAPRIADAVMATHGVRLG